MMKAPYNKFFKTLGNKTRLDIVFALRDKSLNVGQLTKILGCDQSTISHNLTRLVDCHFVEVSHNGKFHYYSLNAQTIEPLLIIIDKHVQQFCEQGCCT